MREKIPEADRNGEDYQGPESNKRNVCDFEK